MNLVNFESIFLPLRSKLIQHLYIYDTTKEIQKTLCGKIIVDGALAETLAYHGTCDHCLSQKRSLLAQHQDEIERLRTWNASAKLNSIKL